MTEIMDGSHLPLFEDVDVIQVGARNMQNFRAAQGARHAEQAHSAQARPGEHASGAADERGVHHGGRQSEHVILCERGIRTFETATRNTLDISAVPVLQAS